MEQMLTCSLCLEIFTQPQTFPCFHSFCRGCIEKLPLSTSGPTVPQIPPSQEDASPRYYLCPLCRAAACTADVRPNFLVNELLQMYRAQTDHGAVCLQCAEGVDSQWKCADCLIELCEKCHLSHLRIPVCRGHRVVPLDSQTAGVIDRLVFCTIHSDQPVMLNCADCEMPLCIKCKVTEHEAHRTETVEKAVERLQPSLQGQRQKIGGKLEELQNELKEMSRVVDETNETFTYCRESIEEKKRSLIAHIEAEAQGQMDRLRVKQDSEMGKLTEKRTQVENKMKEYCMLQDWIGTTLEKTRGAILLVECQSGLQQKVEKLVQQNGRGSETTVEQPTYLSNPLTGKTQGLMGRIEYNQVSVSSILPDPSATAEQPQQQLQTPPDSGSKAPSVHRSNKTVHTCLETLFRKSWSAGTELKVTEGHCAKVRAIGNELWLPLFNQHAILVYSMDSGSYLRKVARPDLIRHPIAVEGHPCRSPVLVAAESGLFEVEEGSREAVATTIKGGVSFSDVCVRNQQMAALEYSSNQSNRCQVHLYLGEEEKDVKVREDKREGQGQTGEDQRQGRKGCEHSHWKWKCVGTVCFGVPNIDKFSALLLKDDGVLVCPSNSHRIYSHVFDGEFGSVSKGKKRDTATEGWSGEMISLHTGMSMDGTDEQQNSAETRLMRSSGLLCSVVTATTQPTPKVERRAKSTSLPVESMSSSKTNLDHPQSHHHYQKPPVYPTMKSPHTPQLQRKAGPRGIGSSSSLPETGLMSLSRESSRSGGVLVTSGKGGDMKFVDKNKPGSDLINCAEKNIVMTLTEYGCQGHQGAGRLYFPMLCGVDSNGCLLVADCHNRRLQLLKGDGQWVVVDSPGHGNDTLEDVVVVSETTLWVLQNWNQLVKYTCTS